MPSRSRRADYPAALRQHLLALLSRERNPLAYRIDGAFRVRAAYGSEEEYRLVTKPGSDLRDSLPALYGCDVGDSMQLPLIEISAGIIVDLNILPGDHADEAYVILLDSSALAAERQAPQQRANETELLNYRQEQLMAALDAARKEAESASRLKSEFIARFSHEFRTPLTSILGYCELLERDGMGILEHAEAIHRSASHLIALVENLLDHGRTEHDRIVLLEEVVNVQSLFDDVSSLLMPLAKQRGLDLIINGKKDCDALLGDPVRLRQIVVNLTGNALRYTDAGHVEIQWRYRRGHLRVRVNDTGPGVPESDRGRIFQPFAQGNHTDTRGGLGLGLPLARHLAESMGGELTLRSTDGPGASFEFSAPLRPALNEAVVERAHAAAPKSEKQRLLVVEDDVDVSTLIEIMLAEYGFECDVVDSIEALPSEAECAKYSVALVDMHLPDGSGSSAIQRLVTKQRRLPVLAMSASTTESTRREALQAGARGLIVKPFHFGTLAQRLAQL